MTFLYPTRDRSLQMILGTQNNWDFCVMDHVMTHTSKNCAPNDPRAATAHHNEQSFLFLSRFTYLHSWFAFLNPELHSKLQTREYNSRTLFNRVTKNQNQSDHDTNNLSTNQNSKKTDVVDAKHGKTRGSALCFYL